MTLLILSQDDSVVTLRQLARDEIITHIARHQLRGAFERIAPATGTGRLEHDPIAGINLEIVDLRRNSFGVLGSSLDQPFARCAAKQAAIDAPGRHDLAVVVDGDPPAASM